MKSVFTLLFALACLQVVSQVAASTQLLKQKIELGKYTFSISLPEGFSVELLTPNLELPRVLHFAGDRLFIGSRSGLVYWLDPPYTDPHVLVTLDDYPHSVVVLENTIYFARTSGIYSAPYTSDTRVLEPSDIKLLLHLPGGQGHSSRTMKIGPDQKLYVSLGISGNCSDEYLHESYPFKARRGGVAIVDPDDESPVMHPFGSGLRNPIGFDWHPVTGQLYATNNGPDHAGYELPPEYFVLVTENSFHGMPWYQFDGEKFVRDSCVQSDPPASMERLSTPAATFPARSAPMDMLFFNDSANARKYINDALVALHGSWATSDGGSDGDPASRREPKLVHVEFSEGDAIAVTDFLTGFQLENGARWARPMGLAIGPDGDIYFSSDDGIQGLFRIRYSP